MKNSDGKIKKIRKRRIRQGPFRYIGVYTPKSNFDPHEPIAFFKYEMSAKSFCDGLAKDVEIRPIPKKELSKLINEKLKNYWDGKDDW